MSVRTVGFPLMSMTMRSSITGKTPTLAEGGMAARIGVEGRDAHEAMHAGFTLEPSEGGCLRPLILDGRRLDFPASSPAVSSR